MKIQKQISQTAFVPSDGFILRYQKLIKEQVIPYQYSVLTDSAPNTEKSHVVKNFINAGNVLQGKGGGDGFYGMVFQDSDAAKWIEACAYALTLFPDEGLSATCDKLIDIIAAAQDKDGYLDTYFTIKDSDKRWTNLCEAHELYCMGHMIEAAVAYAECTGKKKLLDVMCRAADCIYEVFMNGNDEMKKGYPGHPEVELALMRLYRITENRKYLELAEHFIDVRGVDSKFYENECSKRGWTVWGSDGKNPSYNQADLPVRNQDDAKGHAVRAVYLYTGMADLASETGDEDLKKACERMWKSITEKRMYITGGIGSTNIGEAFTVDYDLPGDTSYCETCASIGLMFFASRMLEMDVDSAYADTMERAFYNTVLAGMQLDGKRFFYVNPLEVVPGISGKAVTHLHDLPQRPSWYACACCPPNTARLISSFGKYAYGENDDTLFCHLYAAGKVSCENGLSVICRTGYPYSFSVDYEVSEGKGKIAVRIPGWSGISRIMKNGKDAGNCVKKGYAYIDVEKGDKLTLTLDGAPYKVHASAKSPALTGCLSVMRGPLVYCAEGVDNNGEILSASILRGGSVKAGDFNPLLLGGTCVLDVDAVRVKDSGGLYTKGEPDFDKCTLRMVPYYTWANRGLTQMRVWFPGESY